MPAAQGPDEQPYFEVGDGENPLDVADTLGRPMAILRMGGATARRQRPDDTFLYGSPPLLRWRPNTPQIPQPSGPYAQSNPNARTGGLPTRMPTGSGKAGLTILRGGSTR